MRYIIISDIGGLLWWFFIKFCKTRLEDEQSKDKWSRNIFFFLIILLVITFIVVKFF